MTPKNKILLIEDELYLLKIYGNKLRRNDFDVSIATTGDEGLHKVMTDKPDLILLDLILPGGKDGFQVLEEIKKNPSTRKIPIIILSNLGQKSDIERGVALGAADYLVKADVSLPNVVEKIKKYLSSPKK